MNFTNFTIGGWVKIGREYPGHIERAFALSNIGTTANLLRWYRYSLTSYNFTTCMFLMMAHLFGTNLFTDIGVWYHVMTTYNGTSVSTYVNGLLKGGR